MSFITLLSLVLLVPCLYLALGVVYVLILHRQYRRTHKCPVCCRQEPVTVTQLTEGR